MTFDAVFPILSGIKIDLLPEKHESIQTIGNEVFYVKPLFRDIKTAIRSNYIILSAPGATGKSALAKYLAMKTGGIYWDLSKITLGENSFHGSILRAVGAKGFTPFCDSFCKGEAYLIIDALDEAEMLSGREALEHFLKDLNELSPERTTANVILLARTETAQFAKKYLGDNHGIVSHFEISFFEDTNAKDFITQTLTRKGKAITQPIIELIDKEFIEIRRKMMTDEVSIRSFLGYAPVLEAIAQTITDEGNTIQLINSLRDGATNTEIISTILDGLLEREHIKVKKALESRCAKKHSEFTEWDRIYSPQEQIERLGYYIVLKQTCYNDIPLEFLPAEIASEYESVLDCFLPQHPFAQSWARDTDAQIEFTGPAFRDYVLAQLILNPKPEFEMFAEDYFDNHIASSHFPSQLFYDFYFKFSNNVLYGQHFPYVYDSFKSKEVSDDITAVELVYESDEESTALFSLQKKKNAPIINQFSFEVKENSLRIRSITNVTIDVGCNILVGRSGEEVRIYNSAVVCNKLIWRSKNIRIEGYDPGICLLACEDQPEISAGEIPVFNVFSDSKTAIRISFPNFSAYYKLRPYSYSLENENDMDTIKFSHALRKILVCFRKHKKDAPAKYRDRIDNVILAHSRLKKRIFEFLMDLQIIYIDPKDDAVYKVDLQRMAEQGINWGNLSEGAVDNTSHVYENYMKWDSERK